MGVKVPSYQGDSSAYYATTYYGCISPSYGQRPHYCYTHHGVQVPSCSGLVVTLTLTLTPTLTRCPRARAWWWSSL